MSAHTRGPLVVGTGFGASLYDSHFSFWSSYGKKSQKWEYTGPACIQPWWDELESNHLVEYLVSNASLSVRPHAGHSDAAGTGYIVVCGRPKERLLLNFIVSPKPPEPPRPLSCRLDAAASIDILAAPGNTRRPVAAEVVCAGEGEANAVVRITSPRSVVVADGVTVVLNGQLDESTPVSGGASYPIDLHVDVENIGGEPGGYSVSYVLTVDLT